MSEKPEAGVDERVREWSERYSFHLERWTHGRTPMWARGAFNPRDVVRETLTQVAQRAGDMGSGSEGVLLDCLRRMLYDNVLIRVHLARGASTERRQPVESPA